MSQLLVSAPKTLEEARRLALRLFVVGYEGETLPDSYRRRLADGLAGIILFARNISKLPDGEIDVAKLVEHTNQVHSAAAQPILCAVDQEGGAVARLRAPFTHLPPMRALADRGDLGLCQMAGRQTGRECLAAGFNVDFAPILDIDTNPDNPIIGHRAFGDTPGAVIERAGAFLQGLGEVGVLGCGKHFPGHGDTDTDSHLALPVLPFDRERLERVEMAPFRALSKQMPMVMTAHILFPTLDEKRPATLSSPILQSLLRGWCGFEGLIVSDDLEMKGVAETFSFAESVRLGLHAGIELFLVCRREDALDEAVEAAAEVLLRGDEMTNKTLLAIERVDAMRRAATVPTPSMRAVETAIGCEEGLRLRNELGIGNV